MSDSKLTTVYHPTLPDVSDEVAASDVDSWTEAGWRKSVPKAVAEADTTK